MFNLSTLSIAQLKSMAAEHGIVPTGDRRKAITWATAIYDRMEEIAKASKAKACQAGQGFGQRTAKSIKGLKAALKSPKAKTQYVCALCVSRYLGEQLVQGCELGLRATVWGLAYAVTFAVWLAEQSMAEANWSPIDRTDVDIPKLPAHGPALHVEIHEAALALAEAIALTDGGL